jgi:hypothetical protein
VSYYTTAAFLLFILLPACQAIPQSKTPAEMASLLPSTGLSWQRVRPAEIDGNNALEGPVLYQLLLNASGTPGTIAMFDTNPRHLTDSPIAVGLSNVAIGGLSIDRSSGIIDGSAFSGEITCQSPKWYHIIDFLWIVDDH